MGAEDNYRKIDPRPRPVYSLAEDAAQVMSAQMFKEFCVPYDDMMWQRFGKGLKDGRGMHMCGNSNHLLESLKNDAKISSFNFFGYLADVKKVAEIFGGDVYLWGNISPMLMLRESKQDVKQKALDCLSVLAPCGGLMLGDGANVCPGTPVENLAALTEAAIEYGLPDNHK